MLDVGLTRCRALACCEGLLLIALVCGKAQVAVTYGVYIGIRTYDCARGIDPRHSDEREGVAKYDCDGSRHIQSCDGTVSSSQEAVPSARRYIGSLGLPFQPSRERIDVSLCASDTSQISGAGNEERRVELNFSAALVEQLREFL